MIRVVLVEDEMLARLGLRTFLEPEKDIRVEGEFASAQEALRFFAEKGRADVIITDIEMSGMNGIELIRCLRKSMEGIGVIILSCHDNFRYARSAIDVGVDAYLLKQEISANQLVSTIRGVYAKTAALLPVSPAAEGDAETAEESPRIYAVGAFELMSAEGKENGLAGLNQTMLLSLCESVLRRHGVGTLLHPIKHDAFFLFSFAPDILEHQRREKLLDFVADLSGAMRLYANREVSLGISEWFGDTEEIRDRYDNAREAVSLLFYQDSSICRFYADRQNQQMPPLTFTSDGFLDEGGMDTFRSEMHSFLSRCREEQQPVTLVRQALVFKISQFIWRVLQEYAFPDTLKQRWNNAYPVLEVIDASPDSRSLEERLDLVVKQFQVELLTQLKTDEFQLALQYIDTHTGQKLTLQTMADMSCMSTTTFCRRFKQETGMTLIHYINRKKINEVKRLLATRRTLEDIAEEVGFLNVNYMIRVFKKVEGCTITEFRREVNSKLSEEHGFAADIEHEMTPGQSKS